MKLVCKQCGNEFNRRGTTHKYCSQKCYWESLKGRTYPNRKKPIFATPNAGWFKSGDKPWNTNKKMTQKYCENMSKRFIELNISKGKKNPSWKGGITPAYQQVRRTQEYRDWRNNVYRRDNYTCKKCGKRGVKIEAHHIYPLRNYAHLMYFVPNGITLCKICHTKMRFHEENEINMFCSMNRWPLNGNPLYSVPIVHIEEL